MPTYLDYSQEELEQGFNIVKNPDDWRAPINWVGPMDDETLALVRVAIDFFTATEAHVRDLGFGEVRIQAKGYRMGPAGP